MSITRHVRVKNATRNELLTVNLFVKEDVNLHIARQTQLFLKVNSLSSGTMAETSGEAVLRKNCFLRSQHLLLSRMNMMVSTYCQSLQFLWFCVVVCNPML